MAAVNAGDNSVSLDTVKYTDLESIRVAVRKIRSVHWTDLVSARVAVRRFQVATRLIRDTLRAKLDMVEEILLECTTIDEDWIPRMRDAQLGLASASSGKASVDVATSKDEEELDPPDLPELEEAGTYEDPPVPRPPTGPSSSLRHSVCRFVIPGDTPLSRVDWPTIPPCSDAAKKEIDRLVEEMHNKAAAEVQSRADSDIPRKETNALATFLNTGGGHWGMVATDCVEPGVKEDRKSIAVVSGVSGASPLSLHPSQNPPPLEMGGMAIMNKQYQEDLTPSPPRSPSPPPPSLEKTTLFGVKDTDRRRVYLDGLCEFAKRVGQKRIEAIWTLAHANAVIYAQWHPGTNALSLCPSGGRVIVKDSTGGHTARHMPMIDPSGLMDTVRKEIRLSVDEKRYGNKLEFKCSRWRLDAACYKEPMIYCMIVCDALRSKLMGYVGSANSMCRFEPVKARFKNGSNSHQRDIMRLIWALRDDHRYNDDLGMQLVDIAAAHAFFMAAEVIGNGQCVVDDSFPLYMTYMYVLEVVTPNKGESTKLALQRREAYYVDKLKTNDPERGYNVASVQKQPGKRRTRAAKAQQAKDAAVDAGVRAATTGSGDAAPSLPPRHRAEDVD